MTQGQVLRGTGTGIALTLSPGTQLEQSNAAAGIHTVHLPLHNYKHALSPLLPSPAVLERIRFTSSLLSSTLPMPASQPPPKQVANSTNQHSETTGTLPNLTRAFLRAAIRLACYQTIEWRKSAAKPRYPRRADIQVLM